MSNIVRIFLASFLSSMVNVDVPTCQVFNHERSIVAHFNSGRATEGLESLMFSNWLAGFGCLQRRYDHGCCNSEEACKAQPSIADHVSIKRDLLNHWVLRGGCNLQSMATVHTNFLDDLVHDSPQKEAGTIAVLLGSRGWCTAANSSLTSCREASVNRPVVLLTPLPLFTFYCTSVQVAGNAEVKP